MSVWLLEAQQGEGEAEACLSVRPPARPSIRLSVPLKQKGFTVIETAGRILDPLGWGAAVQPLSPGRESEAPQDSRSERLRLFSVAVIKCPQQMQVQEGRVYSAHGSMVHSPSGQGGHSSRGRRQRVTTVREERGVYVAWM